MKRGDDSGYNDTRESGIVHDAGYLADAYAGNALNYLADAYINQSKFIRAEHAWLGESCEAREGTELHDRMHDTMRGISYAIMALGVELLDHPKIRAYVNNNRASRYAASPQHHHPGGDTMSTTEIDYATLLRKAESDLSDAKQAEDYERDGYLGAQGHTQDCREKVKELRTIATAPEGSALRVAFEMELAAKSARRAKWDIENAATRAREENWRANRERQQGTTR